MSRIEKKLFHYFSKAVHDYRLIQRGDRVMACLSGGKDSYTLIKMLSLWQEKTRGSFNFFVYTLDQSQPGWDDTAMREWLSARHLSFEIETRNTYAVVKEKIPENKTYCSLCSRLRRGNIYRYAEEHGFNKVALGHHRDDLIQTLLMSMCYSGRIRSMPPKLLTDNQKHLVIRPLVYCQEKDILSYAKEQSFPIIPCNLCGSQENLMRKKIKAVIERLAEDNPKVPSNLLHALQSVQLSQLMDDTHWDFKNLEVPVFASEEEAE